MRWKYSSNRHTWPTETEQLGRHTARRRQREAAKQHRLGAQHRGQAVAEGLPLLPALASPAVYLALQDRREGPAEMGRMESQERRE